jgi:acyl transferase domain-containing protein/acyl-CoA synthetase (AMP-forming)/AMP-acid ligase II
MKNDFNNLADVLIHHGDKQTGITFIESENKEEFLSYAELYKKARFVLFNLREYGLKPGDELVFQFQSEKNFVTTFWACMLGGIVPVPILFATTGELRFIYVWKILKNPYLVTDYPDFHQLLNSLETSISFDRSKMKDRVIFFSLLQDNIQQAESIVPGPDDIAFIQFSSGSTGRPKGVVNLHRSLLNNITDMSKRLQITCNHRFLNWMPLTHDLGLIFYHLLPLFNNAPHFIMPTTLFILKPSLWMSKASSHKASFLGSPNFGYRHFLNHFDAEALANCRLDHVECILNTAEPISARLCREFSAKLSGYGLPGHAIHPAYGLAEATLGVAVIPLREEVVEYHLHRDYLNINDTVRFVDAENENAVSFTDVGTTIGTALKITGDTGTQLPGLTVGHIKIKGESVTPGYYNNPGETANTIDNLGWLDTGDVGFITNGRLVIIGRTKDLIIVGGINYYPHDIERILEEIDGLETNETAAASIPDERLGRERVLVFVRYKSIDDNWDAIIPMVKQIKEWVFQKVGLMVDHVIPVHKIPKTTSGKLQRFKLAREYTKGAYHSILEKIESLEQKSREHEQERHFHFPPDEDKQAAIRSFLIKTAQQLVGSDGVDINRPLAEQGFTSLKAIKFHETLNSYFQLSLPISLTFDYPTIAKITGFISNLLDNRDGGKAVSTNRPPITASPGDSFNEDIAVIGMSCRFPGGVHTPEKFWQLLEKGMDAAGEIPLHRFDYRDFYSEDTEEAGKMYTKYGAFLENVDQFDNMFFSITPREAEHMDPQQRILLEVCSQALENAGIGLERLNNSNTGVFIGISSRDYELIKGDHLDYPHINQFTFTGSAASTAVGRISYFLGLQGPTYAIDTACSSSLAAVHQAVQSLKTRESEMALAGGVNLLLSPAGFIASCKLTALSRSGQVKSFDNSADGYVRGEGCGIVVLKRLSDAQKDNDNILALIKGSAVNHDGRSNGLTAPNGLAQEKVISRALANADMSPLMVDYVEAHGSGTVIGDPQEVNALASIFPDKRKQKLLIGSVKSNIGHLEAAAGIAGLIKTVLALQHKKIPPSLHFSTPNQYISWDTIPIAVADRLMDWRVNNKPRTAGVSSFGLSGTNVHVIVSEAPALPAPHLTRQDQPQGISWHILNLSAKTDTALQQLAERYISFFGTDSCPCMRDVSYTSVLSRGDMIKRISIIGRDHEEFKRILADYAAGKSHPQLYRSPEGKPFANRIAFLFTGQGGQYTGMGMKLYEMVPVFREAMDQCDRTIRSYIDASIIEIITHAQHQDRLDQPEFSHLAIFAVEYALAKMWNSLGVIPSAVVGHGIGEYAAACTAGVFNLENAVKLLHKRAQLLRVLPRSGRMLAVFSPWDTIAGIIEPYKDTISPAAVNSPDHIILSGTKANIEKVNAQLEQMNIPGKFLNVDQAFYSPVVELIMPEFTQFAREIEWQSPGIPFVSTVTGQEETGLLTNPQYWVDQMRQTIRFYDALSTLKQKGFQVFPEIGPGSSLSRFGKSAFGTANTLWLPSLNKTTDDWEQLLHNAARLYVHHLHLDWNLIATLLQGKKAILPNYPFEGSTFPLKRPDYPGADQVN